MHLLIYPGIHDEALTQAFVQRLHQALPSDPQQLWTLSAGYSTLLPLPGLSTCLETTLSPAKTPPLSVIAFSAGVVGVSQWLPIWQFLGGRIACLIALDGWGVPLTGNFPIIRLSHDWFTGWSSRYLSTANTIHVYADPAVAHLTLWAEPDQVTVRYLESREIRGLESRELGASPIVTSPNSASTGVTLTAIDCIVQALLTHTLA